MRHWFPISDRHIIYELRGGLLLRPTLMVLCLAFIAALLCEVEMKSHAVRVYAQSIFWMTNEPAVAQLLLGALAGAAMTVVTVVYSILVVALTFASMQFSPRILVTFVKDTVSQTTLGMFLGTFAYCLVVLPEVHSQPYPFVPKLAVTFALVLAISCLAYLMYFIHHIALSLQANYIVDRIANDTEQVLIDVFQERLIGEPDNGSAHSPSADGAEIKNLRGGYVQYIDESLLLDAAQKNDITIFVHRSVGQFIPPDMPLLSIEPKELCTERLQKTCRKAMHIGPIRTMEDDPEFGVLQIVDIALKAISPAVNDPSTAISCIDQLSRLLVIAATHNPPQACIYDANGKLRLSRRQTSFPRLLEIAYNQIIPYSKTDLAVSLRTMRALSDLSSVTESKTNQSVIRSMARRVMEACPTSFTEAERAELVGRLAFIEQHGNGA